MLFGAEHLMVACSEGFDELCIPEINAAHCRNLSGQGWEQPSPRVVTYILRRQIESMEDFGHNLSGSHLCHRLTEPRSYDLSTLGTQPASEICSRHSYSKHSTSFLGTNMASPLCVCLGVMSLFTRMLHPSHLVNGNKTKSPAIVIGPAGDT